MTLIFKLVPWTQLVNAYQNGQVKLLSSETETKINVYVTKIGNKKQIDITKELDIGDYIKINYMKIIWEVYCQLNSRKVELNATMKSWKLFHLKDIITGTTPIVNNADSIEICPPLKNLKCLLTLKSSCYSHRKYNWYWQYCGNIN